MKDSMMGERPFKVSTFAHDLRAKLFIEHLGINNLNLYLVKDPISQQSFNYWKQTSSNNTNIYSKVFPHTPHPHIKYLSVLKQMCPIGSQEYFFFLFSFFFFFFFTFFFWKKRYHLLDNIKGHLVDFCADFLSLEFEKDSSDLEIFLVGDDVFI